MAEYLCEEDMNTGEYISRDDYRESVRKFKDKWFKQSREERLRKYIEEATQNIRNELLEMIGGDTK